MEEPPVVNNQFKIKNSFEEDQSLIDFDTTYSLSDTINNFYIDENDPIDFNSNGFMVRGNSGGALNGGGNTYIYAAFAEHPQKIARAR